MIIKVHITANLRGKIAYWHTSCMLLFHWMFLHMQGGQGTREEMCFAFLNYYPWVGTDLVACGSVPNPESFTRFVTNDIP